MEFHDDDTDTDTDILADMLSRIVARISVSVSATASWNFSFASVGTLRFLYILMSACACAEAAARNVSDVALLSRLASTAVHAARPLSRLPAARPHRAAAAGRRLRLPADRRQEAGEEGAAAAQPRHGVLDRPSSAPAADAAAGGGPLARPAAQRRRQLADGECRRLDPARAAAAGDRRQRHGG